MIFNVTTGNESLACSPLLKRTRGKWVLHPKSERAAGVVAIELMKPEPKYEAKA